MPCCAKAPTNNSGNGFRVFINGSDTTQLVSELKDAGAKVVSFDRQYVPLNGSMLSVAHLADDEKHEMLELAANQLASQGHMVVVTDNRLAGSNCARVFSHTSLPQVNSVEHAERWSTLYEPALEPTHIVDQVSMEDLVHHVSKLTNRNHKRSDLFDLMSTNLSLDNGVGKVYLAPREQHHVVFTDTDNVNGKILFDFLKQQNLRCGTNFSLWGSLTSAVKSAVNTVAQVLKKCAPSTYSNVNAGYDKSMIIELGWLSCAAYESESSLRKLFDGKQTQSSQTSKIWTFVDFFDSKNTVCKSAIKAFCPDTQCFAVLNNLNGVGRLAIVFRGTEVSKISDVVSDLNLIEKYDSSVAMGNSKAKVHSGFLIAYLSVQNAITALVGKYGKDMSQICFGGHSLGAALATLCAANIATLYPNLKSKLFMANFGSPRVGNQDFANSFNASIPNAFRVVNAKDLVTTVPLLTTHVDHELHYYNGAWYRDVNPVLIQIPGLGLSVSDHSICQSKNTLGSCSQNSKSQNYMCSLSILPASWSGFQTCYTPQRE